MTPAIPPAAPSPFVLPDPEAVRVAIKTAEERVKLLRRLLRVVEQFGGLPAEPDDDLLDLPKANV